jgi:Archaeal/vacuolar-type H+-ATPase subunit E
MTPDDNIERLSRDILQQAQSEADQVISEAKSKADQILKRAQDDAAAEKAQILDQAKRDADRIRSQAIATTQLKARTMLLESREKLLTEVFAEALKQLPSVQQWNDYEAIVESLAAEAVAQIRNENVVLRADKTTAKLLTDSLVKKLAQKFTEKITLGDPLEGKTGVVASTTNGHLTFDNTLETRLQKLENELRSPVYHLLMGESL